MKTSALLTSFLALGTACLAQDTNTVFITTTAPVILQVENPLERFVHFGEQAEARLGANYYQELAARRLRARDDLNAILLRYGIAPGTNAASALTSVPSVPGPAVQVDPVNPWELRLQALEREAASLRRQFDVQRARIATNTVAEPIQPEPASEPSAGDKPGKP